MAHKRKIMNKTTFRPQEKYLNREYSWLEFNRRVLNEALDKRIPLLERAKFIAIFSNNLDEFFMKRVGGLKRQIAAGVRTRSMDGKTPIEQLEMVRETVIKLVEEQRNCLVHDILPSMRNEGIIISDYKDLTRKQKNHVNNYYNKSVFPILTPLGTGPGQPFPFISNLSLSLAVLCKNPQTDTYAYARVKIPPNRPRWINVGEKNNFVPLEQIIAAHLKDLFPGMEIIESMPFRVTRNADIDRSEEEAEDLLELIQEELRFRKYAAVVRLETNKGASPMLLEWLCEEMDLSDEDIYQIDGPLNLKDFFQLLKLDFPHLKDKEWSPCTPPEVQKLDQKEDPCSFFEIMSHEDVFVHHPYDSFTNTVQRFLCDAADDPKVLAIKQTLYRTADDSPIIRSLVRAAANGKQVAVLVEIKARFDEANNIQWVRTLEQSGIHVTYGFAGLKTHTKIILVVREEPDGIRRYFHIGTGNYHSGTANIYTDMGVFSCRDDYGEDLTDLFNFLTGHSLQNDYKKLLVAPVNMRREFVKLIEKEIKNQKNGVPGHIIAKMNSLEDKELINLLYKASEAGVKVELIIRGICCLRPGVPGLSENISVISIIGRFLEHSRVYYFRAGGDEKYYFGSADWMQRNLDERVEAITPVESPKIRQELKEYLEIQLQDNRKAWDMQPDGSYTQRHPAQGEPVRNTHTIMMERAKKRSAQSSKSS